MPTSYQNFIVVTKASKNKFSIEIFLKRVQKIFSMSSSRSENKTKRNETDKNRRNFFLTDAGKSRKNIFLATPSISQLCQKLVTFAKNAKSGKFSQKPNHALFVIEPEACQNWDTRPWVPYKQWIVLGYC